MIDATGPSCGKVDGTETGACLDGATTIDDDGPRRMEGKVNIVA